jgi:hypothetical protein
MKRSLLTLVVAASIVAAGCAVQGRPFEKAALGPNDRVIYVYRPYSYFGSLVRPSVTCGEETARIGPGGYHAFVVPASAVMCSVETETADEVEIPADPRVHYIREEIGWGVVIGHPHLNPMDHDTAQSEIASCCVEQP